MTPDSIRSLEQTVNQDGLTFEFTLPDGAVVQLSAVTLKVIGGVGPCSVCHVALL